MGTRTTHESRSPFAPGLCSPSLRNSSYPLHHHPPPPSLLSSQSQPPAKLKYDPNSHFSPLVSPWHRSTLMRLNFSFRAMRLKYRAQFSPSREKLPKALGVLPSLEQARKEREPPAPSIAVPWFCQHLCLLLRRTGCIFFLPRKQSWPSPSSPC